MPVLRDVLRTDATMAFNIALEQPQNRLELMSGDRLGRPLREVRERVQAWARTTGTRWALYTPHSVEPFQRNRAVPVGSWRELHRRGVGPEIHVDQLGLSMEEKEEMFESLRRVGVVYKYIGRPDDNQLRVLACEGATLLAWVGALQPDPFEEWQRELFDSIAPALTARLRLEQRLEREAVCRAALETVLDALAGAALVVDPRGKVVHANAAGRALMHSGRRAMRAAVEQAARGAGGRFERRPIVTSGQPNYYLLVDGSVPASERRARTIAARHGLTPREREVLAGLARGWTNRRIAADLGCAERTVETHVTRILSKLDVRSRAEAIARLLEA